MGKLKENCGAVDKAEIVGAGQKETIAIHQHTALSLGEISI